MADSDREAALRDCIHAAALAGMYSDPGILEGATSRALALLRAEPEPVALEWRQRIPDPVLPVAEDTNAET